MRGKVFVMVCWIIPYNTCQLIAVEVERFQIDQLPELDRDNACQLIAAEEERFQIGRVKPKFGFPMAPPHNAEAKNESAVRESDR